MKKLLKPKDILMLTLAGVADLFEEVRDPLNLVSSAYENMYGFVPKRYSRHNFLQVVRRSLKTKDIEMIVKDGEKYLCLTSQGRNEIKRNFPIANLIRKWNRKWVLVIFDIEEKSRKTRNMLRNKLKNLGFGLLQKSIWVTPLPIARELLEYMAENNLSDSVFVFEISCMLLGDPQVLARKIWKLKELEEEANKIKNRIDETSSLIRTYDDRLKKSEAKSTNMTLKKKMEKAKRNQRGVNRMRLQLLVSLPPLPLELLPEGIRALL